jgi:hypothetical protein
MENKDGYKHQSRTKNKHRSRRDYKHKHRNMNGRRLRKKDGHGKKARAMVGASVDSSSAYSTSSPTSSKDEGDRCKSKKGS